MCRSSFLTGQFYKLVVFLKKVYFPCIGPQSNILRPDSPTLFNI